MRPVVVAVLLLSLVACGGAGAPAATTATATTPAANPTPITSQTMNQLIPQPTSVQPADGTSGVINLVTP